MEQFELTKSELALLNLREIIVAEINASSIPNCMSGNIPVIMCRNSRTAVRRAKSEFKDELKAKSYSIEHDAVLHQIVNSNPKFNLIIKL